MGWPSEMFRVLMALTASAVAGSYKIRNSMAYIRYIGFPSYAVGSKGPVGPVRHVIGVGIAARGLHL